jgi:AhpD family alkylhydroperoxidase
VAGTGARADVLPFAMIDACPHGNEGSGTGGTRMTTAHETLDEARAAGRRLRDAIPEVYSGHARMSAAAMRDGELPAKVKELIALTIAVTRECDGCVVAHAKGAAARGATAQEVAEALGVAILMNGGPGTVWGPRAYDAFQEFAAGS